MSGLFDRSGREKLKNVSAARADAASLLTFAHYPRRATLGVERIQVFEYPPAIERSEKHHHITLPRFSETILPRSGPGKQRTGRALLQGEFNQLLLCYCPAGLLLQRWPHCLYCTPVAYLDVYARWRNLVLGVSTEAVRDSMMRNSCSIRSQSDTAAPRHS